MPIPPLERQHELLADVELSISVLENTDRTICSGLAKAMRLREATLTRAFSGQLVPQDPNDEPAGVLLERIRGARAAIPPRPRRIAAPG